MKLLVIGSGGREHALVWKLAQSQHATRIWSAPGNAGIAQERLRKNGAQVECVNIGVEELSRLLAFAQEKNADLTVVGPDNPLALGIVDLFQASGLCIWGPNRKAARFEASKAFSQGFMERYGIPTARSATFEEPKGAKDFAASLGGRCVVKVDGLALGKGVLICAGVAEANQAIDDILVNKTFGTAGSHIVIQEFLEGREVSLHALCDGKTVKLFPASQDHKRALDGDRGLNTGGMGAYSPVPFLSDSELAVLEAKILKPWLQGCVAEGVDYRGVIYPGVMLTKEGPKVLEFNARFGDPETQVYLPRLENDLVELLDASVTGTLDAVELKWNAGAAVCVVMASAGYPGSHTKGKPIRGLEEAGRLPNIKVFHAGTARAGDKIITNGGRVLGVTAWAGNLRAARDAAYAVVEKTHFEGAHYRRDITAKAIGAAFCLLLGLLGLWAAVAAEEPRPIPKPPSGHPGNVFVVGEQAVVAMPTPGDENGSWRVVDYEGNPVMEGSATNGKAALGKLSVGYYELRRLKDGVPAKERLTIGVVAALRAPTPKTSPIGVDGSMSGLLSATQYESAASLCPLAGINWVRDRFLWSETESEKGHFAGPNKYDDTVSKQAQAGLQVLQVYHDSPAWAGKNPKRQPPDLRDTYRFVQEMARRWRGQVMAFEPWNEGDIPIFGEHTGAELAAFQKASYLGLKAGNPNVIVCQSVFASPQPNVLADFTANCPWPYFDTFNFHHYCLMEEYPAVYAAFRAVSAGKPMWVTEFNIPTLWAGDANEQEPSAENLRLQAERVAQLFASSLHEGTAVLFYYLLPNFAIGQNQFGLLHKDLTPRPGYLALAAVGRLLADAKPLGRIRLEGDVRAFAFRARPDGEERDVIVAWAPGGQAVLKLPATPLAIFDHLGRSRTNLATTLDLSSAPIFAICRKDCLATMPLQPPPARPALKAGKPSQVVLQALISAERIIPSLSAYRCSSARPETFSIFAYNFGANRIAGELTATFPDGWRADLPHQLELAPGERKELSLTLDCRGGVTTPADIVRISGNFGSASEAVLSLRLAPQPFTVLTGPGAPIRGAEQPARWQPMASTGCELKMNGADGGITFSARFAGNDRWAYPLLVLEQGERAAPGCVALAATLTAVEGQANFRAIFEQENGSAYFAEFYPQPKPGETIEALALLGTALFGEGWSRPDDTGKLDPEKIRTIRIGCNAQDERAIFTLKNVRWVKRAGR